MKKHASAGVIGTDKAFLCFILKLVAGSLRIPLPHRLHRFHPHHCGRLLTIAPLPTQSGRCINHVSPQGENHQHNSGPGLIPAREVPRQLHSSWGFTLRHLLRPYWWLLPPLLACCPRLCCHACPIHAAAVVLVPGAARLGQTFPKSRTIISCFVVFPHQRKRNSDKRNSGYKYNTHSNQRSDSIRRILK